MKKVAIFTTISLFAVGCGDVGMNEGENVAFVEQGLQEEERTLTRTIVYLHDDGTEQVAVDYISPREQQAEIAADDAMQADAVEGDGSMVVTPQAVSHDPSCAGSSVWLFDQPNQQGNQICFHGSGTVDLGTYFRACGTFPYILFCPWNSAVKSFRSNSIGGVFGGKSNLYCTDTTTCPMFFVNTQRNATSCEQNARYLRLQAMCTWPSVQQDTSYVSSGQLAVRGTGFRPNSTATVTYTVNGNQVGGNYLVNVNSSGDIFHQYGNIFCAAAHCGCDSWVQARDNSTNVSTSRKLGICFSSNNG